MTKILKIISFLVILLLGILKISLSNYEYTESDIIQNTINKENKNSPDIIYICNKIGLLELKSDNKDSANFNNIMLLDDFNFYESGVKNFNNKRFKESILSFEKLINKNLFEKIIDNQNYKENIFINIELFFSHLNLGNYKKAYKYNTKIISLLNEDTNITNYNFYINYYNIIPKEKINNYIKFLEDNKIKNNLIFGDIFFLSKLHNYNKAEKYYKLFLEKKENNEYIYNQLGLIQDYEYNYKNSLELYKNAYKINKNNVLTLKNLCISRYLNFKYLVLKKSQTNKEKEIIKNGSKEALVYCNQFLEKEKNDKYIIGDAETYKYIGHIYNLGLKNNLKAKDFYLKAIKINPYDYKSYNNLSAIYRELFEEKNNKEIYLLEYIKYAEKAFILNNDNFFKNNLIIAYHIGINYYSNKKDLTNFKIYADKAVKLDDINYGIKDIISSSLINFYKK